MATLAGVGPSRRALLMAAPAGLLAACEPKMRLTASTTPKIDSEGLTAAINAIAVEVQPALLGVALSNLESGQAFTHNGEQPFPMQSVFKLPLGAAVLSEVDAGRVQLDERFFLLEEQLSAPLSPIAAAWPDKREYTARELLEAMMIGSDNAAADVLMKRIGGPGAVTAWLNAKHVPELRVDRYERELQPQANGMTPFRAAWRDPAAFAAAEHDVPAIARLAALRAYMVDPRDTATPRGMLEFLQMLDREALISRPSTHLLLDMMGRTARGAGRLKAGLPKTAFLAHRPGTGGFSLGLSPAHNDVGIFTLADRRAYAVAVFLSGSTLDEAHRDAIIARVAGAVAHAVG